MSNEKRFYVKPVFGSWAVMDRNTNKRVVAYSRKRDAKKTSDGLNRIRKEKNIPVMKARLKTTDGYKHYLT
ncbi:hypothetical protein [Gracilimonas sediminicola]|uniref:hypothetical protein n=1 Tax=Gracilimonas sediminicola TaxID=2952158 RepID=UPI0038D3FA75